MLMENHAKQKPANLRAGAEYSSCKAEDLFCRFSNQKKTCVKLFCGVFELRKTSLKMVGGKRTPKNFCWCGTVLTSGGAVSSRQEGGRKGGREGCRRGFWWCSKSPLGHERPWLAGCWLAAGSLLLPFPYPEISSEPAGARNFWWGGGVALSNGPSDACFAFTHTHIPIHSGLTNSRKECRLSSKLACGHNRCKKGDFSSFSPDGHSLVLEGGGNRDG